MTTSTAARPAPPAARPRDVVRQVVVAVSAVLAVVGSFVGSGAVVGTPVNELADGALSAEGTLVAPDGPAFGIWSVIYLGLIALAVWQLQPSRRADPRQRETGWWVAASMLLNAVWLGVTQLELIGLSVGVIVALLIVLAVVFGRLAGTRPRSRVEAVVLDGTIGLYLGWVSIATVANTASALVYADVPLSLPAVAWAVIVLVVAAVVGVVVAVRAGGRIAFAVALAWGLAWVAVGRSSGPDSSTPVLVTAELAAAVVLLSALIVRARRGWIVRRAEEA